MEVSSKIEIYPIIFIPCFTHFSTYFVLHPQQMPSTIAAILLHPQQKTSTIAVIVLQLCCGEFVYRQANLCSGLRRISLSSIYKKRNLHFLAEVVLEPGSSDPETSTLPMSYCADDEETSFDIKYIQYYQVVLSPYNLDSSTVAFFQSGIVVN